MRRFESTAPPGSFYKDEWQEYKSGLTGEQMQWLRDKAKWERMTLSAVAAEWGVPE